MHNWSCLLLDKIELRRIAKSKRTAILPLHRQQAALSAAQLLAGSALFENSTRIACYFATADEFDALPIIHAIWQAGKQCYLPVVTSDVMSFVPYLETDVLATNRFGILEPSIPITGFFPPDQLDLVLVPLLAFDLQGNRLGTGGGYYDRAFAFLLSSSVVTPTLIGLGYQQQQVDQLPRDAWDVLLAGVLTERELVLFEG